MRYELSDFEWATIKPLLPNKSRGVRRVNDRRVLNGIFWVLRSGAPWRDLPRKLDFGRGPTFRAAYVWDSSSKWVLCRTGPLPAYGCYRESIPAIQGPSRNKLAGPRVLALRQEIRKSAAVAVRAMSVVQIVTRRRAVGSPVCHRHPARRAQLPPLCHHAFRGLRHV